jgi:hypothetical protein
MMMRLYGEKAPANPSILKHEAIFEHEALSLARHNYASVGIPTEHRAGYSHLL